MEILNLDEHDSEEYEGKSIVIYGRRYELGPTMDVGTDKILHRVRNVESGLWLHVLKIHRAGETGRPALDQFFDMHVRSREHALAGDGGLNIVDSMVVPHEQGLMELQPDLTGIGWDLEDSRTRALTVQAGQLLDAGDHDAAESVMAKILERNPSHTIALHNTAVLRKQAGDSAAALEYALKACRTEPNYLSYLKSTISLAVEARDFRTAVNTFALLQQKFPYENALNAVAIMAYLCLGLPEQAALLRHTELLDITGDPVRHLDGQIIGHLQLKGAAEEFVEKARTAILGPASDPGAAAEHLQQAVDRYPTGLDNQLRLGLALAACHRFEEASVLLARLHEAGQLSEEHQRVCTINLAYALIGAGHLDAGADLLARHLGERLAADPSQRDALFSAAGFPVPTKWIGWKGNGFWVSGEETALLVREAIAGAPTGAEVPKLLRAIIEMYEAHEAAIEVLARRFAKQRET